MSQEPSNYKDECCFVSKWKISQTFLGLSVWTSEGGDTAAMDQFLQGMSWLYQNSWEELQVSEPTQNKESSNKQWHCDLRVEKKFPFQDFHFGAWNK